MNNKTPTRANVVVLKQILNLIPRGMINRHARETGLEAKARLFTGQQSRMCIRSLGLQLQSALLILLYSLGLTPLEIRSLQAV